MESSEVSEKQKQMICYASVGTPLFGRENIAPFLVLQTELWVIAAFSHAVHTMSDGWVL